ncbi:MULTISPECIES: hypothetical protein [unclassified Campylobacter]|uniref:hypothetical protein n=1 Tax=unclassified Campylobacter TaxID=2593542 RepID=UPI001472E5FE|nr:MULTISPECIES: hypothetical protein [unclassified Campylobacter]
MAIKDDIKSIQEELNTEEKFLENIIKSERFIKKYKKMIIIALALGVLGIGGYYTNKFIKEQNFKAANEAYARLITNPNDAEAKADLKSKDISLYALYQFKNSMENNDSATLKSLLNEPIDELLKDIIKAQLNEPSGQILNSYKTLIKGYILIRENKIGEAKNELKKIPLNSQLQSVVKNFEHYQGNSK